MRVAIMQPYVFPYLGYYQLLHAADRFVLFDDVNFIKKGWINRNRILLNGEPFTFTVPIKDMSQNATIRASMIADDPSWKSKLLGNLQHAYRKAPQFETIFPPVEVMIREAQGNIADLAEASIRFVADLLQLPVLIDRASTLALPPELKAQERILAICAHHGATRYINPANGAELYDAERFADQGIDLRFLRMDGDIHYTQQGGNAFVPALSMLDLLMNRAPDEVRTLLVRYRLLTAAELN